VLTLQFPWDEVQRFLLILLRVSVMTLLAPIFDSRNIPVAVKAGFCLSFGVFCYRMLRIAPFSPISDLIPLAVGVAQEVMIGAMMGLLVRLLFAAVQLAGELVGFQMGLTIANVVDPVSSNQVSIVSQLLYFSAILIFFVMNGHHTALRAAMESFSLIPPFGMRLSESLGLFTLERITAMFRISLVFGAPMIVSLILATIVIGLIARTVPQMNVFMVALPAKIWVGLFFLGISLPLMAHVMQRFSVEMRGQLETLLRLLVSGR